MNKPTDSVCPSNEELASFGNGRLPREHINSIGEHVEKCDDCAETLNALTTNSDTLVTELRQKSGSKTDPGNDDDRQRVVDLAAGVRQSKEPKIDKSEKSAAAAAMEIPAALKKLVDEMTTVDLLPRKEIAEVIQSMSLRRQSDPQELAKALIREKKLTRFQASAAFQGKSSQLVFGEYVVLEKIGAGGMGVVYRAQHRRMKRVVAIKVLSGGSLDKQDSVDRFYREVEAAAKLLHPNIVTAFDAGQHGKSHFLVMEFVNGKDLSGVLKDAGPLPIAQAVDFTIQTARGLAFAHKKGLIHRDIKPANLLLDSDGTVKILDMGLARFSNGTNDDGLTKTGQIMGTVDYMAPEQATDTRSADARADVYSLGCTLFRLLVGSPVFEGDTIMNKLMAHAHVPVPDLRATRPEVSEQLNAVFQKMVAKSPGDRQQSMNDVIADLENCLSHDTEAEGTKPTESQVDQIRPDVSQFDETVAGASPTLVANLESESTGDGQLPQPLLGDLSPDEVADIASIDTDSRVARSRPKKKQTAKRTAQRNGFFAALSIAGLLMLLYGVIVYFRTENGTLRVEINDPGIEVTVKGDSVRLSRDGQETIELEPGEHQLIVTRGDFTFTTNSFKLMEGETAVVKVDLVPGEVRVSHKGQLLNSETFSMDSGRKLAAHSTETEDSTLTAGRGIDPLMPPQNSDDLSRGLVGHWNFEEGSGTSAADSSGNGNHGTLTDMDESPWSNDVPSSRLAGKSSLRFSTETGRVFVSPSDSLKFNDAVTVAFWGSFQESGVIVGRGYKLEFAINAGLGTFRLQLANKENPDGSTPFTLQNMEKEPNTWNHYVARYDGRNVTLFVNGVEHKRDAFDRPILSSGLPIGLGGLADGGQGMKGNLDDIRIYNRALNEAEISVLAGKSVSDLTTDAGVDVAIHALEFPDWGKGIELPPMTLSCADDFCIEAWVQGTEDLHGRLFDMDDIHDTQPPSGAKSSILLTYRPPVDGWHIQVSGEQEHSAAVSHIKTQPGDFAHVAGVRDKDELRIYVNGNLAGKKWLPVDQEFSQVSMPSLLGARFNGRVLATRISKGPRYTSDFVPEKQLNDDDQTLALYHFDEGEGDVLKDSSGNGYDGRIVAAGDPQNRSRWVRVNDGNTTRTTESSRHVLPNGSVIEPPVRQR